MSWFLNGRLNILSFPLQEETKVNRAMRYWMFSKMFTSISGVVDIKFSSYHPPMFILIKVNFCHLFSAIPPLEVGLSHF